jgi:HlyD family secretion protein
MKRYVLTFVFGLIAFVFIAGLYDLIHPKIDPNELILYGNVDVRQVNIGFRVPGRVAELFFEEGDFVEKGALMAILAKDPYNNEISQQAANVIAARHSYENAELMLERRQQGIEFGGVTREDLDSSEATRNELYANLKAAEAALDIAQDNMNYTQVYAPNDGIVLTRIREPGTVVNPVDPVYTLSIISPVWVRAYINEVNLGRIFYGMKAEIMTDSGQSYEGRVGFISPMAEFTPKTVETTQLRTDLVYRLRVYADNPDHLLKQGMPVTVRLHEENKDEK